MLAQAIKRRLSKEENQKGFTLIELLAVIVILGIIAVIAIPMISGLVSNTKDKADLATARQIYEASRLYITSELNGNLGTGSKTVNVIGNVAGTDDSGGTIAAVFGLQQAGYLETPLVLPSTKGNITSGTVNYVDNKLPTTGIAITLTAVGSSTPKNFTADQILKTELK